MVLTHYIPELLTSSIVVALTAMAVVAKPKRKEPSYREFLTPPERCFYCDDVLVKRNKKSKGLCKPCHKAWAPVIDAR
jgi:hypothetical protein